MALKDYNKAFRYGKKEYESRLLAGRKPTLESLDEVLPDEALSTISCSNYLIDRNLNHWDLFRFRSIR